MAELGQRVLLVDLDPQCNATIFALTMEQIYGIWSQEDAFIADYAAARDNLGENLFSWLVTNPRSLHFLLKPTEDGTAEPEALPPPIRIANNLDLIAGRLTLHLFEAKVGERWSGIYQGDPLAIRTATRVRTLAHDYAQAYGYDIVLLDTSPSLGALNRNLLSLADGFIIPCSPDLFSIYGIRNIGSALATWRSQFESVFHFLSDSKRAQFPDRFVKFLGYTLYNAQRNSKGNSPLGLAQAHQHYASQIPQTIASSLDPENIVRCGIDPTAESIGRNSVIYTHNTFPSMSQKYHQPMWKLPNYDRLEDDDRRTISGNGQRYLDTQAAYQNFAMDLLNRMACL